ncbi:MAG: trigger factor [Deltaproteobacteria bacterium]|nr:trigger factor [Deltaproteobacteria bacterium]
MQKTKIQLEDLSSVKKRLEVTVSAEAVKKEINSGFQSLKSTVQVAGFRKGAIPMNILKSRFGEHVKEDVVKKLIESTYLEALREKGFAPVEMPKIEVKTEKVEEDKDFVYTLTLEITPELHIDDYRGMGLKKTPVDISEKEIEDGLKRLAEAKVEFKDVDRPAKAGDMVVVDFDANLNGAPVKNSKTNDYPIIIGEKTLLPGFDEALTGTSKGETRDADITFPKNYSEQGLGGKTAQFKITIKSVKEKTVPALDEEFAKDMECDSLDALRAKVKDELIKVKETHEKESLKTQILDKLIEKHQFEVPETLVNRYLGLILNRIVDNMRQGNVNPGDESLSPEQLREKYREMAVRSVKEDLILDAISAKEDVQVTEAETDEAVKNIALSRNVSFETLMQRINKEGAMDVIKDGMKHEKVFDIIIESSISAA